MGNAKIKTKKSLRPSLSMNNNDKKIIIEAYSIAFSGINVYDNGIIDIYNKAIKTGMAARSNLMWFKYGLM